MARLRKSPSGKLAAPAIPSDWIHVAGPVVVSGAAFVNIASVTVDLTDESYIWSNCAVSWSPTASSPTSGWRLVIGSQNGDVTVDPTHASVDNTLSLNLRNSAPLAPGSYTITLQAQVISGPGNVQVDHVDLFAMGLAV